jgi:peptide/nickel transport system permease protein
MQRYIVRRLLMAAMILWFISIAVFLLMRVMPGDPGLLQQGTVATPERRAAIRAELHLDKPYAEQYWIWIRGLLTGDLGRSTVSGVDVWEEFKARFPVSIQLMVMTLTWVVLIGIPAGVISAVRQYSLQDYGVRLFATLGLSVPVFWIATLVLLIPAQLWGYAPQLSGQAGLFADPWANLRQFGPPSLVLAIHPIASIMRLTRSALLEVLRTDYIRTARAKGLAERTVLYLHGLKNSLIPVVTSLGFLVAGLLAGSLIVEQIFNLRGLGQYSYNAILQKEYMVAQVMVMYAATMVTLVNLIVDLSYGFLDPRIRYG